MWMSSEQLLYFALTVLILNRDVTLSGGSAELVPLNIRDIFGALVLLNIWIIFWRFGDVH